MSTATFTHKGVEIVLGEDGRFTAEINGEPVTKPTLAAIKKTIDGAGEMFKPFTALYLRYSDNAELVKVTSIGRERGRFSRGIEYRVSNNTMRGTATNLHEDTPENLEIFKQYKKLYRRHNDEAEALRYRQQQEKADLLAKATKLPPPEKHPAYKPE